MQLFKQFLTVGLLSATVFAPAFAGVLLDFTPITGWDSGQAAQLPPLESGWSAYLLSARSDDNALISAVDVQLRGNFAQRWGFEEENPLGVPTPTGLGRYGMDSHLLPAYEAIVLSSTVSEDFGAASHTSPSGARVGSGNSLRGVWGIPGNQQRSALDLAYLVIPSGSLDQLDYNINVATNSGAASLRKGFAPPVDTPAPTQPDYVFVGEPHTPAPKPYSPPVHNFEASTTTQLSLTKLDALNPAAPNLSITEPGWASYLLSASSTDGAKFSAVDLKLQGNFHQYWGFNEDAGEALANAHGASRSGVDTHLLPAADAILLSDQFGEDLGPERNITAGGSAYGVGSSIKGVWGIPGNSQAETLDLAYIVAPEGFSIEQLHYSIDLARSSGGVEYLRNGFALPEPPPSSPNDPHSVTGQPHQQTPGTWIETVVREDGSVVREEVPILGWQPGDPWGAVPPTIPEPEIISGTHSVIASDGSILLLDREVASIDRIRTEIVNDVHLLYLDDQLVGYKSDWRVGAGNRLFTKVGDVNPTDDPSETVVITTQESALERLVRTAITGEQDIASGEFIPQFATMYLQSLPSDSDIHGTNWAMGSTGYAFTTGTVIDGWYGYDSDSSYAYMMLSDGNAPFEAIPEPSAIVITLAGIAIWFRRRKN